MFGSRTIGPEHILLGMLREDRGLAWRVLPRTPTEQIREELATAVPRGESIPTNIDLPISEEGKAVLDFADKEAERMQDSQIAPEHLLLGILSQEKCLAARILAKHGLTLEGVRSLISSGKLRDVRNAMRAEHNVAPSTDWRGPRVPKLRGLNSKSKVPTTLWVSHMQAMFHKQDRKSLWEQDVPESSKSCTTTKKGW